MFACEKRTKDTKQSYQINVLNKSRALYLRLDNSVKVLQIDPLSSSNGQRTKSTIIVTLYNTTKAKRQRSVGYLPVADKQTF